MSSTKPADEDKLKMQDFFNQVAEMRKAMELIRKKTDDIERAHKQALNSVQGDEQAECTKKTEMIMDQTNLISNKIRVSLKEMNKTNTHLEADFGSSDPNLRIRVAQHSQLTKAFIDTMNNYQNIQERYKLKFHQQLQRQYLIVNPGATPDELAKIVENEGGSMMSQQVIMHACIHTCLCMFMNMCSLFCCARVHVNACLIYGVLFRYLAWEIRKRKQRKHWKRCESVIRTL